MRSHYSFISASFTLIILPYGGIFSQNVNEGAKPKISINGIVCAIENQQFSCLTKTCDSIVIYQGDSIQFCTDANVDLFSDTAYYMQWDFNGSSNFPVSILDTVPSSLPICYVPVWNVPGIYSVDIYYNGWLSAYPGSDCYPNPSNWSILVSVLPLSGVQDMSSLVSLSVFPNPASSIIAVNTETEDDLVLEIRNLFGQKIFEKSFRREIEIDVSFIKKGLYVVEVRTGELRSFRKLIIE